jgi:acyl-homoserine lactone acylase PvdQ
MVSVRMVMPLSDLGQSTLVHPGGQSGQPGHALYRTHWDAFVSGDVLPLWFRPEDIDRETSWTLVLTPEK